MKRILITSPHFIGEAEVVFREDGILVKIDMSACNMKKATAFSFKNVIPAHFDELQEAFKGKQVTICEAEFEVSFDMFWKSYSKKINRLRCIPLWNKLSKTEQALAYLGIKDYDRYLKRNDWRSKADPENYLRSQMWHNEWK
jgi:hypothetical protein